MKKIIWLPLAFLLLLVFASCGPAVPEAEEPVEYEKKQSAAAEQAQEQIRKWLGESLSNRLEALGTGFAKEIGGKIAASRKVNKAAEKLGKTVLKDREVKKKLKSITSKATSGFSRKAVLLYKAMKAGGTDAYKDKVIDKTQTIAVDVITDHVKKSVLPDDRMSELLRDFTPAFRVQAEVSAMAVKDNLSPEVVERIRNLANSMSEGGDFQDVEEKVREWIGDCEEKTAGELEKFVEGFADLESVDRAIESLAVKVLFHRKTKDEIRFMLRRILRNREVEKSMVKVVELAAFEKGDSKVRAQLVKTVQLPVVNKQLFSTMKKLARSKGAMPIVEKHLAKATKDPGLAALIEKLIVNVLDRCGASGGNKQP